MTGCTGMTGFAGMTAAAAAAAGAGAAAGGSSTAAAAAAGNRDCPCTGRFRTGDSSFHMGKVGGSTGARS